MTPAPSTDYNTKATDTNQMTLYNIIRSYAPHLEKQGRTIQRGLTLEQAQAHCSNPKTRKVGEWFDCYSET